MGLSSEDGDLGRPVSPGLPKRAPGAPAFSPWHNQHGFLKPPLIFLMITNYWNYHHPPGEREQLGKNSRSLSQGKTWGISSLGAETFAKRSGWLEGHDWAVRGHQKYSALILGTIYLHCFQLWMSVRPEVWTPLKYRHLCRECKEQEEGR